MTASRNKNGHQTPRQQLVTTDILRAKLAELELRMVDRIGRLETRLDQKLEKMSGRLWLAFSILAALIVGFGIFG